MMPSPHALDAHKFAREAPLVQQLAREIWNDFPPVPAYAQVGNIELLRSVA